MIKRILKILIPIVACLICETVSAESIEFYSIETNEAVNAFTSGESIYAKITDCEVGSVIVGDYDKTGKLNSILLYDTIPSGGYQTPIIDTTGREKIKLFVWDSLNSMKPLAESYEIAKSAETFDLVFKNTDRYIYRVGNKNPILLKSLFCEKEGAKINSQLIDISVEGVEYTYTKDISDWENGQLTFLGEGIAEITIREGENLPLTLTLEVTDAYNVTDYSGLSNRNSVLLCDIKMPSGQTYRLTDNKTLYGNGFTFDVTDGAYKKPNYDTNSYVVYLGNSNLNNVQIVGKVYTQFGATRNDDYNRAIVLTSGDCVIANSYISNGASPLRTSGRVELVNTTLKGGIYANIDHRSGQLILDNVTTINQVMNNDLSDEGKTIVGLGIVVYQEGGTEDTSITIKNSLTQYNYLSKSQADEHITDDYAMIAKNRIFGSEYTQYQMTDGSDKWVNTGIISMNNYITSEDIIDEREDSSHGYFGTSTVIDISNVVRNCYVYTEKPTKILTAPEYKAFGQYEILPDVTPDFDKNYIEFTGDNDRYCYYNDGMVYVSMNEGEEPVSFDTSVLSVSKLKNTLDYTVKLGNEDVTGKVIQLDSAGNYKLEFTYTDPYNYSLTEDGKISRYSKEYIKILPISVKVRKAGAKNAEFKFGSFDEAYPAKTVTKNSINYVMPDVDGEIEGKIGSLTVDGVKVYYPITEMFTSDGVNSRKAGASWYACFPIFKDALQITDYADNGCGEAVYYNENTVKTVDEIPETLFAQDPVRDFRYQMSNSTYPAPGDKYMLNDIVCYTCNRNGLSGTNTREELLEVAEYRYQDNVGRNYVYYIGYHCPAQTQSGGCVTADTKVTLADGTQKRIDELKQGELLKVWDFEKGEYTTAPICVIRNHGFEDNTVITLKFSDNTETKTVNEHGYYNKELNRFVVINEDTAKNYIGHSFVKETEDGYTDVVLEDVIIEKVNTQAWSLLTEKHYNFIADNAFSITSSIRGLYYFMPFEIGDSLKLDKEKKQQDIEKYGLYTYEDFADILTAEQFDSLNMPQLKVAVGKGIISWQDLMEIIRVEVLMP